MPLTGQAKTDYQREYMRKYRSNAQPTSVRPLGTFVRPDVRLEVIDNVAQVKIFAKPFAGELTKDKQAKGFNK